MMEETIEAVRRCREDGGIPIDPGTDVNRTGLIGLEYSPLTTSLGNLGAKRTSANPDFAAFIVRLLNEAGCEKGDPVAIGASSSFPALIAASLCAAKAMKLQPLLICSLGASQWGANDPRFHWLDIQECLRRSGLLEDDPIAVSLGGEGDTGQDMSSEGRILLLARAKESGIRFLEEPDLVRNVQERLRLYEKAAGRKKIKAFINIGGSWANMGTDSAILKIAPGLISHVRQLPPPERRGVLFEMAARKVPVIHLLHVRGLCERFGLAWDPSPFPAPGQSQLYRQDSTSRAFLLIVVSAYFTAVTAAFLFFRKKTG